MGRLQPLLLTLLSAASLAWAKETPQLGINIAPEFKDNDAVSLLNITLRIQDGNAKANSPLLYMDVNKALPPEQQYSGKGLTATDDKGSLPISYKDTKETERNWVSSRDPVGDILVNFAAEPRDTSGVQGRADLRSDQGGAFGMGANFIPFPPGKEEWNVTVDWDIPEEAPEGTRFASSFGDTSGASGTGYPSRVLHDAFFAIGKLNRWPKWEDDAKTSDEGREFSVYWIGELPYDTDKLSQRTKEIYTGTATYFGDSKSDFRVFYRRDAESFGGQAGYNAFILEYNSNAKLENPENRVEALLSHEIIHNFAQMSSVEDFDKWYAEGIAEYLAAIGPYSGKTLDRKTFVQWLNDKAQDYYTASPLEKTWEKLTTNYWTQGSMVVKAPYTRGFMYLVYVQGLIAKATDNKKSLDDIILELYHRFLDHKDVTTKEFLDLLGKIIGKEAAQASFDTMANGTTLVPDPEGFARYGLKMVPVELEDFSLGMNEGSLGGGEKAEEVVKDSRAAKAGIRNGDLIVDSFTVGGSSETYKSTMRVVVERDGKEKPIEYWPRSYEKVKTWKWVEAE